MGIPVAAKSSATSASTNPFYLTMPPHEAGDFLLVVGHGRYSAATLTAAAGTALASIGNQGNCGAWWKFAESSSEVFSSNYASAQSWQVICIKDIDTTSPIKGTAFTSITGGAYSLDSGTIDTTGDNDCLIVHAHHVDSGVGYRNPFLPRALIPPANAYSSVVAEFEVRHGAGVSTARKMWGSTNAGGSWHKVYSIALRNKASSPAVDLTIKSHPEVLTQWGGALGASGITVQAPNAITGFTALDGINLYTASSVHAVATPPGWGNSIQLSESVVPTTAGGYAAGAWMGTVWSFTSTVDFVGKTLMLPIRYAPNWDGRIGAKGTALIIVDDQDHWVAFQLHPQPEILENIDFHFLLSCDALTPWQSSGTMRWGTIKRAALWHHRLADQSGYTNYLHTYAPLLLSAANPTIIVGHYLTALSVARMYAAMYAAAGGIGHTFKQGRGQLIVRTPLQLGDGSTKTVVVLDGQSIEFPAVDASLHRISNNSINLTLYGSASDTFDFDASILATEIRQTLTIHASHSLSAVTSFIGASFIGWDVVWKTGVACKSAAFSGCYTIDGKAQKFDTDTFVGCALTSAAYLRLDGGVDTDNRSGAVTSTFTKGGESYAVELRTAGFYDFTDTTFTGYTNELHISGPAGTYNIKLAVGQTQPDVYNPNSRTIVWDVPTVDVTFEPLEIGSQLVVYAQGTTTEMFRDDNSATSEVWADASGAYDYTIMKAGMLPVRGSGTSPTASITIDPQQKIDWAYVASSGLVFADLALDFGSKHLKCNVATTIQNLHSFLIESWIAQSSLRNKDFIMSPNGPNGFALIDGWETRGYTTAGTGIANTTLSNLSRDGLRYLTGTTETAVWAAILTSGVPAGKQVRYQQSDAGATVNAVNTGNMDQLVQTYGDATHGNFDKRGYLVLKVQAEGYDQAEVDTFALYGSLGAQLYSIGLTPTANGIASGDPALTITITQGTYTEDGKTFSVKIVDNATPSSGTDILRELRYNFAAGGTYQGEDAFNWHDLVQVNGSDFKTVRGTVYGTATTKGVLVYKNDGTTLHPDFTLFTADDGSTYSPPVTADISITSMPDAGAVPTRLQIFNSTALTAAARANSTAYSVGDIRLRQTGIGSENTAGLYLRCTTAGTSDAAPPTWNTTVGGTTTDGTAVWTTYAVLYYDADPGATSLTDTYIDGEEFLDGESVEVRFAEMDGSTSFKTYSTTAVVNSAGFSVLVSEDADDVYATNALDGSDYESTFSPNFTLDYMVLDTNTDFAGKAAFAYYCYTLTTSAGMWGFWGGVTALDEGNYRVNTAILNLYFDESAGFVKQTDNVRIFRDDGLRPAIDPTTGGHGIEINWRTPVSVVTTGGSAVLPQDIVDIAAASGTAAATATLAAAQTTPIHSDVRKVVGITVDGTGTDGDPWGPV